MVKKLKFLFSKLLHKLKISSINNTTFGYDSKCESNCRIYNSSFGKYSYCGNNCSLLNTHIGSFSSISDNVVSGGSDHPSGWISTSPVFYDNRDSVKTKFSRLDRDKIKEVFIGNDVWIGSNAIILSGVVIGDGAIIGAGSVVTKDVAPYAIFAGNPAKHIRYRFEEEIVEDLIKIQWWNKEDLLKTNPYTIKDIKNFILHFKDTE